jgi:hypothetical protein
MVMEVAMAMDQERVMETEMAQEQDPETDPETELAILFTKEPLKAFQNHLIQKMTKEKLLLLFGLTETEM